jgi:two-component system chemotaxis response regulator CheY
MANKVPSPKPVLLVVEDDPATRKLYEFLFTQENEFDTITAASSAEALKELSLRKLDVVVVDHGTPEVDGIQLTQTIKQASPSTRVVLLVAFDRPGLEGDAKKAGVDQYLTKPFDFDTLVQAIKKALSA